MEFVESFFNLDFIHFVEERMNLLKMLISSLKCIHLEMMEVSERKSLRAKVVKTVDSKSCDVFYYCYANFYISQKVVSFILRVIFIEAFHRIISSVVRFHLNLPSLTFADRNQKWGKITFWSKVKPYAEHKVEPQTTFYTHINHLTTCEICRVYSGRREKA